MWNVVLFAVSQSFTKLFRQKHSQAVPKLELLRHFPNTACSIPCFLKSQRHSNQREQRGFLGQLPILVCSANLFASRRRSVVDGSEKFIMQVSQGFI
ncbi:hypothetical protein ACU8KH_04977 [Lachancea thermotolerans]